MLKKLTAIVEMIGRDQITGVPNYPITCSAAAALLGCTPPTVSRTAKKHGVGHVIGKVRALTAADVDRLRKLIRSGPGNPSFTPGNYFGEPGKRFVR